MMFFWFVSYFYKRFCWLSFDVVIGAGLCHWLFYKIIDNQSISPVFSTLILVLVTWAVYVLDRRIDNARQSPNTPRHRFQAKHQPLLQKCALGALALAFVLCFWLPASVLKLGFGLAVAVILYLLGVWKLKEKFEPFKDVFVPMGYVAGVWATVAVQQSPLSTELLWLGISFWLIAQQNLLINAYFESFTIDEGNSLAIVWGEDTTRRVLTILAVLVWAICLYVIFVAANHQAIRISIWLAVAALAQHFLWQKPQLWLPNEQYRYLGEATFWLLPLLAG